MRKVAALALTLGLAGPVLADDRGVLQAFLEDNLSGAGREVRIEGFRGALSSQASLARLTIADAGGVWLTLEGVTLDWTRSALFSGALEVNALTADRVTLERLPTADDSALPSPEAGGFALPDLPVSVRIGRIAAPEIVVGPGVLGQEVRGSIEASAALAGGEGRIALTLLRADDGPEGRIALSASYANASGQLLLDLDAEEGAGGIAATLLGLPDRPAVRLRVQGAGPVPEVETRVTLASDGVERLAGTVRLSAAAGGGTRLAADLGGDLAPLFLPEYATFFGDELSLKAEGVRAADGAIDLSAFDLRARTLSVTGRLAVAADGVPERFALDLMLADPTGAPVLLPVYGPPTRLDGARISLGYDRPEREGWTVSGDLRGLDRPDLQVAQVALTGSGRIGRMPGGRAAVGGTLEVAVDGLSPRDPALAAALGTGFGAETVFSLLEGSEGLRLGRFVLAGADYDAGFSGRVEGLSEGFRVTGTGLLRAADLSRFAALAERPLAGRATAEITGTASPLGGEADFEARIDGNDLAFGQAEVDRLLRGVSSLRLSARRTAEGTELRVLEVRAGGGLVTAEGRIASAGSDITARLDLPDAGVLGEDFGGALRVTAGFRGATEDGRLTVEGAARDITTGRAEIDGLLRGETTVALAAELAGGAVSLERLDLAGPQAAVSARGRYDPAGHDLRVTAEIADLAALGRGWAGGMRAEAALTGAEGAERLSVSATGRGLSVGNPRVDRLLAGETRLSADLLRDGARLTLEDARLSNPQVTAEGRGAVAGGARSIAVSGRLANLGILVPEFPGALSLSGTVADRQEGYGLDLRVQGPGRIAASVAGQVAPDFGRADLRIAGTAAAALANPFLGQRALSGEAAFDLALRGPPALSSLSGSLRLAGGRLSDPDLPFALTGITASADLSGGAARVALSAAATTGGALSAEGRVGLRPPFDGDLALTLDALRLRDPQLYDTRASGALRVAGPLAGGGRITGDIVLAATELRIPDASLAGTGPLPDIRHLREPGEVRDTRRKAGLLASGGAGGLAGGAGGAVFGLDLTVSAPNRIFLRGRGLDLELGGALRLGGTTADVRPSGSFDLVRGRLDILGRRLDITEARLDLQGDLIPTIRAAAVTDADGETVSVVVEGPATAPAVRFQSSSGLPDEEALARLLFGQEIARISAFQAAQLAAAVATLAGRGGEGIISRLRKGFGLDDLDIQTDADGNATLKAGRYLTDNVYSGLEVAPGGKSRVTLNLDLREGVTVKGSVDSEGQSGIGIYIENDY